MITNQSTSNSISETDDEKSSRLKEYEEMLDKLNASSETLKRHGINPEILIKLLEREIEILRYPLK